MIEKHFRFDTNSKCKQTEWTDFLILPCANASVVKENGYPVLFLG